MSFDPAAIEHLYDTVLAPKLSELEGLRHQVRGIITKAALTLAGPFLLFWFGDFIGMLLPPSLGFLAPLLGIVLIFGAILYIGVRYLIPGLTAYLNYRQRFKHEIVAEIFKIACPTAAYDPNRGIPEAVFDEPGLFATRGSYKSDDLVRGTIGDTPFEAAEVGRQYSTGGKNSTTYIVFKGLFFHIDFNKKIRSTTIVVPESAPSYRLGDHGALREVSLEDPDFEREFAVYSDDEVEARYILTPAMMERLRSLRARAGKPVHMAFKNHRVYLGIHFDRALFEPGIASTTSREAIVEMAGLFALADTIVRELDLNTRIWTKDVDSSLLQASKEAPPDPLDAVAAQARAGTLTTEQLWSAAMAATGATDAADDPVSRPEGTAITIDRAPGSVTVSYGGTVTMVVLLALWAASVLISVSAARALVVSMAATTGVGPLLGVARVLPAIPLADDYTGSVPIAWLLGAAIPGSLLGLAWMLRVRRVEIGPDSVHILRGLRPFPRRYPRPLYEKVIVDERAVYIGRSEGLNLVNPSASPMLKAEEARWVAHEMRQAIKETAGRTDLPRPHRAARAMTS